MAMRAGCRGQLPPAAAPASGARSCVRTVLFSRQRPFAFVAAPSSTPELRARFAEPRWKRQRLDFSAGLHEREQAAGRLGQLYLNPAAMADIRTTNIDTINSADSGYDIVIVCTGNEKQAEYWQQRLESVRGVVLPAVRGVDNAAVAIVTPRA